MFDIEVIKIIIGVVAGLSLGAIAVWVYDTKLREDIKRLAVVLLMAPYITALFIGAANIWAAIGFSFPIGIIGLKWFARLRASKAGDDNE